MLCSFQFKQFAVSQEVSAMKVGTDGVLIGAWVSLQGDERRILDVGTGTGLIALMLAQRTAALAPTAATPTGVRTTIPVAAAQAPTAATPTGVRTTIPVAAAQSPATEAIQNASEAGLSDSRQLSVRDDMQWVSEAVAPMILGIEIDPAAANEAAGNFAASPWAERLCAIPDSLQSFLEKREQNQDNLFPNRTSCPEMGTNHPVFVSASNTGDASGGENPEVGEVDLIVSNPPFFKGSLKAPEARRRAARHDDTLPPAELIAAARELLSPAGRLAVVYPPEEARAFVLEAEAAGLYLTRLTRVISVAGQPPKRHLLEFSRTAGMPLFDDLVIGSAEYRNLTGDFYL